MTSITPELIRDIAVRNVEGFLNNKIPLSAGMAKEASAHDLNQEQMQRAIEATNNIAYLKILELSDDRLVEFPLCKSAEVLSIVAVPENLQEKYASANMVKQASTVNAEESVVESRVLTENETLTYFIKQASFNRRALEDLQSESIVLKERLVKAASELKEDSAWLDKLSCVTSGTEFAQLSTLVTGNVQTHRDIAELGLFKSAQLKEAENFVGLYKKARQIVREMQERAELCKRADDISSGQRIKNLLGEPVNQVGKAIGYVPGKAIGTVTNKVVTAPFKAVGAAGTGIKNTFNKALDNVTNGGKPTIGNIGKATVGTAESVVSGIGKKIMRTANPLIDIALNDPGVDSTTGRSNDVWSALQKT